MDCSEAKIPCEQTTGCMPFRRDCTKLQKEGKCWENYCRWEKASGDCKPKKNVGENCSADKECDRSLCERQKDQKEGTCGSAVSDPYLTAASLLGWVGKWSEMPATHSWQDGAIKYHEHVSTESDSTVKALFIPFTSKKAAFFGFDVTRATGMEKNPDSKTTHDLFMQLYGEAGLHEWIQEKTPGFDHITFFGENTGGLMAQLARMKASESQESQQSDSKKRFHLTAFMEKSRYLKALPEFFTKDDEDVCKYTRIHGIPKVNTRSMKKNFVNINPCAGYEGTFKVKMTDPFRVVLVGGGIPVAAGFVALIAVNPIAGIAVALSIGGGAWFVNEFGGKKNKKKSGVLFGALPTEGNPQAHIKSN